MGRDFWTRLSLVLHALGAIASLGPTLTYGMWLRLAERSDPATRAFVLRSISWLDRRLPTPAYTLQLVTGLVLIWLRGWDFFATGWLFVGTALYLALLVAAVVGYAPAFRSQRALAERIAEDPKDTEAAARYPDAARVSNAYGITVTILTVLIAFLMVWKPDLW
jgi:uncharacterized membrane protein